MAKANPYIKVSSTNKKEKVHSWVCSNDRPKCISVSVIGGAEYLLDLKSLLVALKHNNFIK